jgi:hypothetical protein
VIFQYVLDPDNANVRTAAVEVLATAVRYKLKSSPAQNVGDDFAVLTGRCFDTSLSVRLAVLNVSSNLSLACMAPNHPSHDYTGVLQFLRDTCKLVREKAFVCDEEDAQDKAQPSRTFLSQACQKVATMLKTQEEDSIRKGCITFFQELWFDDLSATPTADNGAPFSITKRAEELLETIDACFKPGGIESPGIEWLELCLVNASDQICAQYLSVLEQKIYAINNIQDAPEPFSSTPPSKPFNFNDFETRSKQLLPVTRALEALAKARPQLLKVSLCLAKFYRVSSILIYLFIARNMTSG